jgi:hypothetical protein
VAIDLTDEQHQLRHLGQTSELACSVQVSVGVVDESWSRGFFAEVIEQQIRRGVHRSTRELEHVIRDHIKTVNDDPKPFRSTKSADKILASVKHFCLATLKVANIIKTYESNTSHLERKLVTL